MTYWETVHQEEMVGFTIKLEVTHETELPDWYFESELERTELIEQINNGSMLWFAAKVSASKCDIELATGYLDGCCYKDIDEFINDGYYNDLVHNVITTAKQKIIDLAY